MPGNERTLNIELNLRDQPFLKIHEYPLRRREINFVFGESGVGKSIIHRALFGLPMGQLTYQITGAEAMPAEWISGGYYIFQEPSSHLNPAQSLYAQINEGDIDSDLKQEYFSQRLIPNQRFPLFMKQRPTPERPSGGEKQRVHLVGFLKQYRRYIESDQEDALFVLDEATAHLDEMNRNRFFAVLSDLMDEKPATIVLITHDYSVLEWFHDRYPKRYADFHVTEFSRHRAGQLRKRRFKPESFHNWLETLHPMTIKKEADPILTMQSGFQVFDFTLHFERLSQPSELIVRPGQITYLKSESGGGKTTVIRALLGLVPAGRMRADIDGVKIDENTPLSVWRSQIWGRRVATAFQNADEALNPASRVIDIFTELRRDSDEAEILNHIKKLIPRADADFLRRPIRSLSGGQKQRINLLRAMFLDSPILFLDEPLKGMDFSSIRRTLEYMITAAKNGRAILLISHQESIFDRLIPDDWVVQLGKSKTG